MKTQQNLTAIANQQLHPVKPIIKWVVKQRGKVIYENTLVSLCWHFIHVNNLKLRPEAIR